MKTIFIVAIFSLVVLNGMAQRRILQLPEIPGYITLACDFHQHTVFSDGDVWPTTRLEEAESRGLDVISITDHIEYQPKKEYVSKNLNAAWEIAKKEAEKRDLLLIHGAEITRKMPPGHFNALFISDAERLNDPDFMTVMEEAIRQNAFIQWNHPGWKGQRADGIPRMDSIHHVLFDKGWIHGIEVVNYNEFYPDVVNWCLEKQVAMTGNSDIHGPMGGEMVEMAVKALPVTLVFARSRTEDEVRTALTAGRTMVWFGDSLVGKKELASTFFANSLSVGKVFFSDENYDYRYITNQTDILYSLEIDIPGKSPLKILLAPKSKVRLRLLKQTPFPLAVKVKNVIVRKGEFLTTTISARE
jgi:hypothetical protein